MGAHLTVDEWAVTCTPPDDDGDVRFEAKMRGEFHGASSAHVARLFWIAFDASGSIPLLQGDNTLNQDIDDEDGVEIEASGYGKLGDGVDPAACQIRGQVVLYPGDKQEPWTLSLPEAGQTGGEGPAWADAGVEIAGWRLSCSDTSDESASYTLSIVARNFGPRALAAVTFRVRVKNRKGDVWSTEHLAIERPVPAEMRSVETTLYVSERAKARKGALIEVVAIVSSLEIVIPLAPVQPVAQQPEPDDTDEDEVDDAELAAAEDSSDDTGGDALTEERDLDVVAEEERTMAKKTTGTKAERMKDLNADCGNPDQLEDFIDAFLDTGALRLRRGKKLEHVGIGRVDIECTSSTSGVPEDSPDGSRILRTQDFSLIFQADQSPTLHLEYYVDAAPDDPDDDFRDWKLIAYRDSEHDDPTSNPYINEFIHDLHPVVDEEDGD